MSLEAIVFDVDGALAETDELDRTAFNLTFRALGLGWVWAPTAWARLRQALDDATRVQLFARTHDLPALSRDELRDILELKEEKRLHLLESGGATLRPGIARLVTEARLAKIKMAIRARSTRASVEYLIFNRFGPDGLNWFDAMITGDDFKTPATALDSYDALFSTLDARPAHCMAIESSASGTKAATAFGLNVIATPGRYTSLEDFSDAKLVLSDLGHPSAPFELIDGQAMGHRVVTIDALSEWLRDMPTAA